MVFTILLIETALYGFSLTHNYYLLCKKQVGEIGILFSKQRIAKAKNMIGPICIIFLCNNNTEQDNICCGGGGGGGMELMEVFAHLIFTYRMNKIDSYYLTQMLNIALQSCQIKTRLH